MAPEGPATAELAARNIAALKLATAEALGHARLAEPGLVATDAAGPFRGHNVAIALRPAPAERLAGRAERFFTARAGGPWSLQDYWGVGDLRPLGYELGIVMPVLRRPPAPPPAAGPPGLEVRRVAGAEPLWWFERTLIDGFPFADLRPPRRGALFDERVLDVTGLHLWVGLLDGAPAATAMAFVAGGSVGVYWVATLPGARGRGLGGALTRTALAVAPELPAVLSATPAGVPVYRRLGFRPEARTWWWSRSRG
ncbi:MAG TPA: GNAT family N-acetyltransferase [Actinomycetes bacterium]|nr:GNAT family N-acetyltransferase [Actinomycetes bacterium]